jgi:hypothetical protein
VLKYLVIGFWVCGVALGSAYGVMLWQAQQQHDLAHAPKPKIQVEQFKTKMISVPIVYNDMVVGYVLAQFSFTVRPDVMETLDVKPDLYLIDEAFRIIYGGEVINFQNLRKPDVAALGKAIKENVNKRIGKRIIHDVFVRELNYLPKEQFRSGGR